MKEEIIKYKKELYNKIANLPTFQAPDLDGSAVKLIDVLSILEPKPNICLQCGQKGHSTCTRD